MNSVSLRKIVRRIGPLVLSSITIVLILFVLLWGNGLLRAPGFEVNTSDDRDMLGYVSNEEHLILYDPLTRIKTTLHEDVNSFVLGRDGRVAFTKSDVADANVYVFDPAAPSAAPVNISQNPDARHKPLAWHPNGQYLAYTSYIGENDASSYEFIDAIDHTLLIWDGEMTRDAMLEDGQPAFTIVSRSYLWDNVPPRVQWHVGSDIITAPSSYWEDDHLIGLTEEGQVRFSFTLASGLPSSHLRARNAEGRTLFRAEVGSVAWSRDGYLAYCRFDGLTRDWILSLWNGRANWDVARTSYKPVQWRNGDSVFSCNSG